MAVNVAVTVRARVDRARRRSIGCTRVGVDLRAEVDRRAAAAPRRHDRDASRRSVGSLHRPACQPSCRSAVTVVWFTMNSTGVSCAAQPRNVMVRGDAVVVRGADERGGLSGVGASDSVADGDAWDVGRRCPVGHATPYAVARARRRCRCRRRAVAVSRGLAAVRPTERRSWPTSGPSAVVAACCSLRSPRRRCCRFDLVEGGCRQDAGASSRVTPKVTRSAAARASGSLS